MEERKVPYFLLCWLKDNLNHYHYRSPEAKELRETIQKETISQDAYNPAVGAAYWKFVKMLEANPFNGNNREHQEAQILAEDFYYYFYPIDKDGEDLWYPMALYIRLGDASKEQTQGRLLASIGEWNQEAQTEEKNKQARRRQELVSGSEDIEGRYGNLLRKPRAIAWCEMLLLLAACVFCGWRAGIVIWSGQTEIWKNIRSLEGIIFWVALAAAVGYLVKDLFYVLRERRRIRLVKAWKNRDKEKTESKEIRTGFRNEEDLKKIISHIFQTQDYVPSVQNFGGSAAKNGEEPGLNEFNDPGTEKILNTARPIQIVTVMLAAAALCMLYAGGLPAAFQDYIETGREFINEKKELLLRPTAVLEDVEAIKAAVQPEVQTNTGGTLSYRGVSDSDGEYSYIVSGEDGSLAYLRTEDGVLTDSGACSLAGARIIRQDGSEADASGMFDGNITTGCKLEKSDKLQIDLNETSSLYCIYLINGCAEDGFQTGVTEIRISFGEEDQDYIVWLDADPDISGYYIGLPEVNAGSVTLEIQNTAGEEASISEIMIYPE